MCAADPARPGFDEPTDPNGPIGVDHRLRSLDHQLTTGIRPKPNDDSSSVSASPRTWTCSGSWILGSVIVNPAGSPEPDSPNAR